MPSVYRDAMLFMVYVSVAALFVIVGDVFARPGVGATESAQSLLELGAMLLMTTPFFGVLLADDHLKSALDGYFGYVRSVLFTLFGGLYLFEYATYTDWPSVSADMNAALPDLAIAMALGLFAIAVVSAPPVEARLDSAVSGVEVFG